jgi:signal transduction histidine kinase
MSLRGRVLLISVFTMGIGYLLVTLASVAQIMQASRTKNADLARNLFCRMVQNGLIEKSGGGSNTVAAVLAGSGLITDWKVVRLDGSGSTASTVVVCSDSADVASGVARPRTAPFATARAPDGARYELQAVATLGGMGVADYLAETWSAMLVGTALVAVLLLVLLNRQVLTPVAELAAASRHLAVGGMPARLSGENRNDELGQLVRSFNRMAAEVLDHRAVLEKRVAEATEQCRRAQEAAGIAQRLAATGKLAAGVAHEINNPLGGMVNAARRLEKVVAPGTREREYLQLIHEGLERIGSIVKQMTQFQRASRELAAVDMCEAVRGALRFAEHRLGGIEVQTDLPEGLPVLLGDRQGLEQVVLNLLINAADAVRDSAAKRLTVRVRSVPEGDAVETEITDSGCGMTPEECAAAFDIFHSTKPPGEGSGLGLPIAHTIVQGHGGSLTLESGKGRGTRALIRLPVRGKGEGS